MWLGDFGETSVLPRDTVENGMTAIVINHSAQGFVIAADGRLRCDDESRRKASSQILALETNTQQKIFQANTAQGILGYAVTGTVRDPQGFDLMTIAQEHSDSISTRHFGDVRSYLRTLGGKINKAINDARQDGTLETLPQTKKVESTSAWYIAALHFSGYFNGEPCLWNIEFSHQGRNSRFDIYRPCLKSTQFLGSEIVRNCMYGDGTLTAYRDPRFYDFVRGVPPHLSLENAREFAIGYIAACSSPLGLEVDEPNCKGIGGHIHMATITQSEGFVWAIEPVERDAYLCS